MVPKATEITLDCSDGIRLAAQSYKPYPPIVKGGKQEDLNILCLHGWMDNCRSFHTLAPALISQLDASILEGEYNSEDTQTKQASTSGNGNKSYNVHVVALDLPGHGLSAHRSMDAPPLVRSEYLFYIAEAVRQLNWWSPTRGRVASNNSSSTTTKFVLVGHSMSAGIALLYAAAFPEQVRNLVMLDSVGHLSRPASSTSEHLRTYVQSRQMDGPFLMKPSNRFYYPTLEAAIQARCRSASAFPGNQYISEEGARELVLRGVVEEESQPSTTTTTTTSNNGNKQFRFRHDQRLQWASLQYFTNEQVEVLYRDVQCPTCVLLGENGWPIEQERRSQVQEVLQPTVFETLPGSHHLHADPDTADRVATEIVNFLQSS